MRLEKRTPEDQIKYLAERLALMAVIIQHYEEFITELATDVFDRVTPGIRKQAREVLNEKDKRGEP